MKVLVSLLSLLTIFFQLPTSAEESGPPDPRKGVFRTDFPYESQFVDIRGHKIHYVDEGEGDTFVFLHGNPTSMYLWRNVMRYVEPAGRLVAMDNLGFGNSAKPKDLDYTFQMHYEFLEAFVDTLELDNIIFVIHDWGSVLGLNYAVEHPDRVKGVVFMEAIIPPTFPMESLDGMGSAAELFGQFRQEESGKRLLIEQNMFIEQILLNGPVTRSLTQAEKEAYREPFRNPDTRFPIYVWPNELPINGEPARNVTVVNKIGKWLQTSDMPKLLQYASPGAIISPSDAEWMANNYSNIETQFVGYGTHYIQEDNPQSIGRGIVDWHRRN